jgi:Dyp-type peroxidase family
MPPDDCPVADLSALLQNQIALDQIGAEILNGGPRAIRFREDGGTSMVFVARHDDVASVLTDESNFSVRHYDPLYTAVAHRNAYLIMRPQGPERAERMAILKAAEALTPWFGAGRAARSAVAKECVEEALATVRPRHRFDLIGEYAFFVPYLIARRVLGLTGPRSFDFRVFLIWVLSGHSPFRFFRPKIGPYMADLAWSEFVIAQLLINFDNRKWYFRWAASWGAKRLRAQVERLADKPPKPEKDHTLLSALWAAQKSFPLVSNSDYREHVVSIMMELGSTLFVVPGSGFSGIITRWLEPGGPGLEASLRKLEDMDPEVFAQEELRLAPPSAHLLRNATHATKLGGLDLEEDEYVCALVKSAGLDIPDEPDEVKVGRSAATYLHFGPENGPHRCVSHWLSPTILAEMFLGLTKLQGLRPRGKPWSLLLVPGRLTVEFGERLKKRPSSLAQQPPFLICVSIDHDKASPGDAARDIESLLDGLGNPAEGALKWALGATKVIHFLSMSVIWDKDSNDPPVLVADIAGDGDPKTIIAALVKYAGALLLPIFQAAAGVEDTRALQRLLASKWVKPVGAALPLWPRSIWHRATGLAFQGTPGLTLKRIRDDERIAVAAKAAVFGHTPRAPSAALSYLGAARTAAGLHTRTGEPFVYSDAPPSLAGAGFWPMFWSVSGLVVLDWSFLFIILFALFYVNFEDLLQSIILAQPIEYHKLFLSIPVAIIVGIIVHTIIKLSTGLFNRIIPRRQYGYMKQFTTLALLISILFVAWLALHFEPGFVQNKFVVPFAQSIPFYPIAWWVALVLGLLSLVVFVLLVAGAVLVILRHYEAGDKPCDADPDARLLAELMRGEDLPPHRQNHMISVSPISPGLFSPGLIRQFVSLPEGLFRRFVSLPAGLYVASLTVRSGIFKTGFLAGIASIHFIQWARIPGTGKLVFTANYDGSFQSYLEDAIALLPGGATGIWSNAVGFPRTSWLFSDGATDGDRFKRWVRRQMIPTRFWYSAYPHLTSTDIRLNAAIRQGLEAETITPSDAEVWLKLFGSAPRPVSDIEADQIQGLALTPYRNLLESALLAVTFTNDPAACRAWLADVRQRIDFGDGGQSQSAMAVALSARGLKGLGRAESESLAARFSPAFAMGMADEARANVLGDVGENAPEKWDWGGPDKSVDAVLLIYAVDRATLLSRLTDELASCAGEGLTLSHRINLHRWPPSRDPMTGLPPVPIKEPFGFVDGISQPSIKGLLSSRGALKTDLLEPGEFILGYPDGLQRFPPTPQVFAKHDPRNLLPDLPPNFPPPPSTVGATPGHAPALRDLGRNGSYLVIRQLKQDVKGFNNYLEQAAREVDETADWVAAKMVGRWKNGAPLVLFPDGPPGPDDYNPFPKDEKFRFGRDDPQGLACPFGAHIRRANPRDQFDANDKTQMKITNRHRILRRGRSYVNDDNDSGADPQGLLFMCLNADIERQFELLQQTWIGSTSFGPLCNEADPLTALNRKTDGTYTIPTLGGPKQLTGMPSFVSVIGGGYFFLPGRQALAFLSH